jgi:hypothetical protein
MLSASIARIVAKRSGPATLSVLLVCGVLASVYVPGKIGQRFRTTRGSRQLEDGRTVHDCEVPSLDARFSSHASAERSSSSFATLSVSSPAVPAALVATAAFPVPLQSFITIGFPRTPVRSTGLTLQPFAARPPPQA